MIGVVEVISTAFDKLKRLAVQSLVSGTIKNGYGDVRTPLEVSSYGIDSNPIKGKKAIYITTNTIGYQYILGYIQQDRKSEVGETRVFSTDADGQIQAYIWLKNADNILELNGNEDNAVLFSKYKEENDKLKATVDELVQKWNAFTVSYVPGGPSVVGTPPTLSTSNVSPNNSNFDLAKNEQIKTNG